MYLPMSNTHGGCRGRDRMVVGFTLLDKVCQWLATGQWFSSGTLVSSTNKTDHHDITEILLKVALNTINQLTIMGQVWANKHFVKEGPILTYNSNSIFPLLQPYLMKSATCCALPNKLSFPPRPIQIAHTIVDFPVPFGPIITFK